MASFRSDPRVGSGRRRDPPYAAGLNKRRLWKIWRTLLWGRSIENMALAVSTQNMVETGNPGIAFVAAPELP
jgi:hypothetical protein